MLTFYNRHSWGRMQNVRKSFLDRNRSTNRGIINSTIHKMLYSRKISALENGDSCTENLVKVYYRQMARWKP